MANFSPITFFKQVRAEARRISWPTRRETMVGTIAVFIMVFVASIFLFVADQLMAGLVHFIMGFGL